MREGRRWVERGKERCVERGREGSRWVKRGREEGNNLREGGRWLEGGRESLREEMLREGGREKD